MPGYERLPIGIVADEGKNALAQGVKSVLLFGIPAKKDEEGTQAYAQTALCSRRFGNSKKLAETNL